LANKATALVVPKHLDDPAALQDRQPRFLQDLVRRVQQLLDNPAIKGFIGHGCLRPRVPRPQYSQCFCSCYSRCKNADYSTNLMVAAVRFEMVSEQVALGGLQCFFAGTALIDATVLAFAEVTLPRGNEVPVTAIRGNRVNLIV